MADDRFAEMDDDELTQFHIKVDSARAGATRARDDAHEKIGGPTADNLDQCAEYFETLAADVADEMDARADTDEPETKHTS